MEYLFERKKIPNKACEILQNCYAVSEKLQ